MSSNAVRRFATAAIVFFCAYLAVKYLFPLLFPFVLGTILAFAAEPAVSLFQQKTAVPRWVCSGIGVTLTLVLLATTLYFLGALAVRQLGVLANTLPDLQQNANQGISVLQNYLSSVADRAPEGVRPLLSQTVNRIFGESSSLLTQASSRVVQFFTGLLARIPDGALGLGTSILASFMISARLTQIKAYLSGHLPEKWRKTYLPTLARVRKALGIWLKAQLKLMGITYLIVLAGLIFLKIPYAPFWALLVALVDAFPVLGTGTVLIPWAIVCFLRSTPLQAVGLLCIYGVASLTRSVLEPRLVGRGLGIDPLVTLVFFYIGYQLLGFWGILLAPLLATAVKTVSERV